MKAAVVYRSLSGHSKKLARAIASQLNLTAQNIKAKPQLNGVDLLFVVGGVYGGKSLPDMTEYIKSLTPHNVKKAVIITSSASNNAGQDEVRQLLSANGIEVAAEEYRCFGGFIFLKMGHPNKQEIENAVAFTKQFLN